MTDQKVIVIERSDSEARALETLLHFLDLEPLSMRTTWESCGASRRPSHECFAVILGGKDTVAAGGGRRSSRSLRALPQPLPVIHLGNDGLPRIAGASGDLAWFQLEMPGETAAAVPRS